MKGIKPMQTRKLLLSSAIAGAVGLLTATAAMAWDDHTCSCTGFTPAVTVVQGPCPVSDPTNPVCVSQGDWTGVQYKNTGTAADYLSTLVTVNNVVSTATGNQAYSACSGDPTTKLGKYSCHEQAVKVNTAQQATGFWVVAKGTVGKGQRQPILTSIAAKKGSCTQSFAVMGLGLEAQTSPFQTLKKTETVVFKGCAVTFEFDSLGNVTDAFNDVSKSDPTATCSDIIVATADKLTLTVDVPGAGNLGLGQFGDGYISTGTNSCTTRMVGGKVYIWGSPCPNP
jgi:hypothetical protein